ncbi:MULTISPECIES: hypothetical protein [unclassified Arthrobacter]|uniref:hypothetical protein n=1 Tax=unclassified Arthrobacter TaxID=235627 RepID=UPI001D14D122|nr:MULTISPECIES: hypothetical protein [unclassified Arthrobacter]MCC3275995.1 hypothetical protein [Arthrobacter sp. zg-Y20]MCC9176420.1 hypothetical protein [Arthrobacter sp. zg-Y750]MDK1316152.1 hypothetical protein [Arthrobacter sp. zg.Y20]WIB05564.1 hypothetical protein QNO06_13675 [Arthrobacter sp. zg-Y20]
MIDALLRPPETRGEVIADVVRALGILSVAGALLLLGPVETALFLLVLLGLLVARSLDVIPGFDTAYGLVLLLAAWSSVADLYARISWWDLAIHCAATGVLAAMSYFLLVQFNAVPAVRRPHRPSRSLPLVVPVLVLSLGLALSVLWEMGEWWGNAFVDGSINVGYGDTMGDLAAGGLGGLVSGVCLGMAVRRAGGRMAAAGSIPRLHRQETDR